MSSEQVMVDASPILETSTASGADEPEIADLVTLFKVSLKIGGWAKH